ncbi:MAG: addiction module toxin RelE [Proteobacteria bacterium]|nr:MAG: addiction module toxin RelE [Pseudomonadota bacterium]
MKYWLHPEAEEELGAAAEYYALHASTIIAEASLAEFERILGIITTNQQFGTPVDGRLRKYPLCRFPYFVIYRENVQHGFQIYAVARQRRVPEYWHKRTNA